MPSPASRPAGLAIREATPADAADVARLLNLLGSEVSGGPGAMTAGIAQADLISGARDLRVLLAEVDGVPAGVALHGPAYESAFAARGRMLLEMAVEPAFRRRGVGRALIARLARLARDEGCGFVWWLSTDSMPAPRGLYRAVADIELRSAAFYLARDAFDRLADEDA